MNTNSSGSSLGDSSKLANTNVGVNVSIESYVQQFGENSGFVREMLEMYLFDPSLVSEEWKGFFSRTLGATASVSTGASAAVNNASPKGVNGSHPSNGTHLSDPLSNGHSSSHSNGNGQQISHALPATSHALPVAEVIVTQGPSPIAKSFTSQNVASTASATSESALIELLEREGHLYAAINPIESFRAPVSFDTDLFNSGLGELLGTEKTAAQASAEFNALKQAFCGSIGYEYSHLRDARERAWFRAKALGRSEELAQVPSATRKARLKSIIEAETFESELHRKYVGAKRFSVEGGETLLPLLQAAIDHSANLGAKELIFGMAHRGRLNVLTNIIRKPLRDILIQFEDKSSYSALGAGDVKYHVGYASSVVTAQGHEVSLSLAFNPSHLEFVNPVVEGMSRAIQDRNYNRDRRSVVPVLIHGDAAFIGQGVVAETINMAGVTAYDTGGTIHVIVNNQIGFTTPVRDARATHYSSDLIRGFDFPVLHVNAEDVDAACWAAEVAAEYRHTFGKDICIDLYCWRKYGHNEGDDPNFTQPIEYAEIREKRPLPDTYLAHLKALGIADEQEAANLKQSYQQFFDQERDTASQVITGDGCPIHGRLIEQSIKTAISEETANLIAQKLIDFPEDFTPHQKLRGNLEKRVRAITNPKGIEWGVAESLAFGSLLLDGVHIRLTGQDAERGTFSHRHLVLKDSHKPRAEFRPLDALNSPGAFEVYNSVLSEMAVMGFEYGYSLEVGQRSLNLWEAQFGDFANGAQVIIDQFLSSSEAKWNEQSGLVLLLPHGYEGQGPEHSSARLERFLQLGAEGNIRVVYPSNGAQYFHLLREQGLKQIKRPVVVMTPKSLLRLPDAGSSMEDFTKGAFKPVIETDLGKVKHTVLCTGKVYYDLMAALTKEKATGVRVIRIEELYPFPFEALQKLLKKSASGAVVWLQEEPRNMGAWSFVEPQLRAILGHTPEYIGRPEAASTADGSNKYHVRVQGEIVREVLGVIGR